MNSMRQFLLLTFIGFCLTACTAPTNSNTAVTQATPSPTASPSPSPQRAHAASMQVTLPLLDALLTDDKFVDQLKSRLRLSDDQIASLKRVSTAEIDRLRETNAEELNGNATDARSRAAEQLRGILGEEKANELASLVHDYWSKGDPTEAANNNTEMLPGPNAVPSDTRVVVNIPAYRMDLFEDGSLVKSYKIGIGYPEFPLPLGLRKAQTIIFNPTWTPPDSPWVAEMKNVTPGETVAPVTKTTRLDQSRFRSDCRP